MPELLKLNKHKAITGTITCKTGMHIGGSKDDIEVGGTDSPIIRDPVTRHPYIPGSSLKGKLRSYLEYKEGKGGPNGTPCGCGSCLVCRVFGSHSMNKSLGPTRIIVRDALLNKGSREELAKLQEQGIDFSEVKKENIINRATGLAADRGLRTQERVPAGTKFDFTIHVRIFDGDPELEMVQFIERGLKALEVEYLGGSGTRGYGWVSVDYTIADVP